MGIAPEQDVLESEDARWSVKTNYCPNAEVAFTLKKNTLSQDSSSSWMLHGCLQTVTARAAAISAKD